MKVVPTKFIHRGLISMDEYNSNEFRSWFNNMLNTSGLYLGPSNAVPLQGSYFISASTDGGHFLLRGLDNKVRAFLNVCRHREKRILLPKGEGLSHWRGRLTSLTCGGHDWGYGFDGAHVSPKTFMVNGNACPIEGDHNLHQVPIEDIGGLYWTGNESQLADIRELLQSDLLKESGITHFVPPDYQLHEVWVTHNRFRPDTGMEVFGDISHVLAPSVHGGTLMRFVDPNGLKLDAPEKSRCGNVQKVPFLKTTDTSKMSDAWRYYREAVLEQSGGETPPYGAVWIAHYPDGTTIEHFPYAVVVSRFAPDHHTFGTRNVVEFYFSDEILAFNPDLAVRFIEAYKALAHEDAELSAEMDLGSMDLSTFGLGNLKSGPAHPIEEWAVSHYEQWLHARWEEEKKRIVYKRATQMLAGT